jgi:hypothetical protein
MTKEQYKDIELFIDAMTSYNTHMQAWSMSTKIGEAMNTCVDIAVQGNKQAMQLLPELATAQIKAGRIGV